MITEHQLQQANTLIEKKNAIKRILFGFDSPHVETTLGLVGINAAALHKVEANDQAEWFHMKLPKIEKQIKCFARGLLEEEQGRIQAELSTLIETSS